MVLMFAQMETRHQEKMEDLKEAMQAFNERSMTMAEYTMGKMTEAMTAVTQSQGDQTFEQPVMPLPRQYTGCDILFFWVAGMVMLIVKLTGCSFRVWDYNAKNQGKYGRSAHYRGQAWSGQFKLFVSYERNTQAGYPIEYG